MWSHRQLAQISESTSVRSWHTGTDIPMVPQQSRGRGRDPGRKDRPDLFLNTAEDFRALPIECDVIAR